MILIYTNAWARQDASYFFIFVFNRLLIEIFGDANYHAKKIYLILTILIIYDHDKNIFKIHLNY